MATGSALHRKRPIVLHGKQPRRERFCRRQICRHWDFRAIQSAVSLVIRKSMGNLGFRATSILGNIKGHTSRKIRARIDEQRKRFLWPTPPKLKTNWNGRKSSGPPARRPLPRPSGRRPADRTRRRSRNSRAASRSARPYRNSDRRRLRRNSLSQPAASPLIIPSFWF